MPVGLDKILIERFAQKLTSDLSASVEQSGVSASGNLSRSFRYELTERSLRVYAAKYANAVEVGRKPTQASGSGQLRKAIRKWIDDKGIIPKPSPSGRVPSKDSLAYAIAKSIHQKGTLLHRGTDFYGRNKPTEIITGVVNDGRLNDLKKGLITSFISSLKNEIQ